MRKEEREQGERLRDLIYCNPFRARRMELERALLGDRWQPFTKAGGSYHPRFSPNMEALVGLSHHLLTQWRYRWEAGGVRPKVEELKLYEFVVYWQIFHEQTSKLDQQIERHHRGEGVVNLGAVYREMETRLHTWMKDLRKVEELEFPLSLWFAFSFQIRRAFFHIFHSVTGGSRLSLEMRARVWDSIFSRDMSRYLRGLHRGMSDIATLITGPSGSGKELVARGIGWSQFIPYDVDRGTFVENFHDVFLPVNLSALSKTLIESELFGHRKGAFTGALEKRIGYLEAAGAYGVVFLDEIGETEPDIQVKLLRVIQDRSFQPLGDTQLKPFAGKIIAATNRNLGQEIREGRFREDLYFRLCADMVETPSLRAILDDSPDALASFVEHIADRVGGGVESQALAAESMDWIQKEISLDYAWPGNFRELEQCVRNILVHGTYYPPRFEDPARTETTGFWEAAQAGELSQNELLHGYAKQLYRVHGSYERCSQVLQVDRRTARKYVLGAWPAWANTAATAIEVE